jgi:hypothetical protein
MAAGAPPHGAPTVEEQEEAAGVGILLQISMLVLAFVLGHLLRRRRVYYLPEASASLLIGTCVRRPRHLLSWGVSVSLCSFHNPFGLRINAVFATRGG